MLGSIKNYLIAALGVIAAIAVALMYRSKAIHEAAMRKGVEKVRETEKKAAQAMVNGLTREREARANAKDSITKRNFFGS